MLRIPIKRIERRARGLLTGDKNVDGMTPEEARVRMQAHWAYYGPRLKTYLSKMLAAPVLEVVVEAKNLLQRSEAQGLKDIWLRRAAHGKRA